MELTLRFKKANGAICAALWMCAAGSHAALIQTTFSQVDADTWDVSFKVRADAGQTVQAFSVYFDWAKVSNLAVQASPATWDSIAIPEDTALSSDGIFDSLALGAGIGPGTALGGFTARFDWSDPAAPAALAFTINDPNSFVALESGRTEMAPPAVPEPGTWLTVMTALGALAATRTMRRRATSSA